jgi:hypothetical protein
MGKVDKKGRSMSEHGTYVTRSLVSSEAWRAMSTKAQILYVNLRHEWKGAQYNNNGNIKLSYRQAAYRMGIGVNAAMRAFHELQAKGFIAVTRLGALGVEGQARGPSYELMDVGLPNERPKRQYLKWQPGKDFKIVRHKANNPSGHRGEVIPRN